jgi:large subunit ribosomal protein L28
LFVGDFCLLVHNLFPDWHVPEWLEALGGGVPCTNSLGSISNVLSKNKFAPTTLLSNSRQVSLPGKSAKLGEYPNAVALCFVIRSVTIKTSVFYPLKRRKCRVMALKCAICGKAPHYGNVVSHANNTRRRRWNPNLKRVRAVIDGVRKQVRVCTGCIRLGRVKKAA